MTLISMRHRRLPFRTPPGVKPLGKQVTAGVFAVVSVSAAAFVFADNFDVADKYAKTAVIISLAAALIGAVLTMVRLEFGPPLVIGGLATFIGQAVTLVVTRVDLSSAFSSRDAKIALVAGGVGVVAVFMCASLMDGPAFVPVGALIALLAIVVVACSGALLHVDKVHHVPTIAILAGYLVVALCIILGGLRGHLGVFAVFVAAGVQIPPWLQFALHHTDRKPFAVAGFVITCVIVLLAIGGFVFSLVGGGEPEGPENAVVSPFVTPMVAPVPVIPAEPRLGPVLSPVSAPVVVNIQPPRATGAAGVFDGDIGMAAVPAQWSPDPYGRYEVRYWNGKKWTDHVSTRGVTALDPI